MNVRNELRGTQETRLGESILGEFHEMETNKAAGHNVGPNQEWEDYAIAYKGAGDHLVFGVQDRLMDEPHLACPIMFLYRHYLELALKEIINHLQEWHDVEDDYSRSKLRHQPRVPDLPGHPLMDSWDRILSLIDQMEDCKLPECTIDELNVDYDGIGKRINEFDKADRSSFNYRYPVDKKGRPNKIGIPDSHQLGRVKTVVEEIDFQLASISYAVREAKEQVKLLFECAVDSYYQDLHADYVIGQWKDSR